MSIALAAIRARSRVEPTTGCWLWTGPPDASGYGQLRQGRTVVRVHRLACELRHGQGRPGDVARHSDACTSLGRRGRLCCNPDHLAWGSEKQNATDRSRTAPPATTRRTWS